ncbi:hypothetical protein AB0M20_10690 [Actinoplanes sp. NPDC051633]|uniref:hypothetical protein n=1 Tax=Actinoplanes sp. NPDC051633 TaxID=3155670 RepID=UPI003441DFE6
MPAEELRTVIVREVVVGTAALVVVALAVPVVIAADRQALRALVVAVVAGVLSAVLSDWRSRATVVLVAIVVSTAVLRQQSGIDPWHFTPLIVLAWMLGTGYRRLSRHRQP